MITKCPHCGFTLTFSDAQRAKLQQALNSLEPGKRLTIKCPNCKKPIRLNAQGEAESITKSTPEKKEAPASSSVHPPPLPDLGWLETGQFEEEKKVEDVPMALVLHPDPATVNTIRATLESSGYRVLTADSADNAIKQVNFINFTCIIYHTGFESVKLEKSIFHAYMLKMAMERRRYIFYILMGPQFHSLYDLEALVFSANLIIKEEDLQHFDLILRKSLPTYEELFGPFLEELGAYGKR